MTFSDVEIRELRRVLAAFKSALPSHELGWYITSHPRKTVVVNEVGGLDIRPMLSNFVSIRGYGSCLRCGQRFVIPEIGNFSVHPDYVAAGIEAAKEWVSRDAERAGPCWGDVPQTATDENEVRAVMDGA